jgi:hypothetical protein
MVGVELELPVPRRAREWIVGDHDIWALDADELREVLGELGPRPRQIAVSVPEEGEPLTPRMAAAARCSRSRRAAMRPRVMLGSAWPLSPRVRIAEWIS